MSITLTETVENITVVGDVITVEVGTQGPPGVSMPAGGLTGEILKKRTDNDFEYEWATGTLTATAIVTDSEPLVGSQGELWFNDSTEVLKVYANNGWQTQTMDDGFY